MRKVNILSFPCSCLHEKVVVLEDKCFYGHFIHSDECIINSDGNNCYCFSIPCCYKDLKCCSPASHGGLIQHFVHFVSLYSYRAVDQSLYPPVPRAQRILELLNDLNLEQSIVNLAWNIPSILA